MRGKENRAGEVLQICSEPAVVPMFLPYVTFRPLPPLHWRPEDFRRHRFLKKTTSESLGETTGD